jgi:hypothetical protein
MSIANKKPEMIQKTDWYPGNVNPVHIGEYEVYRPGFELIPCDHLLKWNGRGWEYAYELGECDPGDFASMWPECKWRGLTAEAA